MKIFGRNPVPPPATTWAQDKAAEAEAKAEAARTQTQEPR